jgi:ABC-2 type transport system permease protein
MNLWTAFKKEWLEQRRTHRLLIAVVVLAAFGMLSPLMAKFMPEIFSLIPGAEQIASIIPAPTVNDAVAQYIKNITQFGVLMALLFCMGAVASEKEKGTAALVLSKPMGRGSFILAKFLAVAATFGLGMAAAALGGYYYTYYLFEPLAVGPFLAMNGLILVYMLFYSAVTLFFSTLTRTQFVAIGGAAAVLIVSGIFGSLPTYGKFSADTIVNIAATVGLGQPVESWWGLWTCLGLTAVALIGAWLIFRRQEL